MSFFYDLNKKLDSIRATPEVTHKQLNERNMSQHAKGIEKYTKPGMEKLSKLGREGASKAKMDATRKEFNQYDNEKVSEESGEWSKIPVGVIDGPGGYDGAQQRIKDYESGNINRDGKKLPPVVDKSRPADKQLPPVVDKSRPAKSINEGPFGTGKKIYDLGKRAASGINKMIGHGSDEELLGTLRKDVGVVHPTGSKRPTPPGMQSTGKRPPRDPDGEDNEIIRPDDPRAKQANAYFDKQVKETGKKLNFADKIANAKKEVDEMLGDVAAEAMRSALSPKQKKMAALGGDPERIDARDLAALRKGADMGEDQPTQFEVYYKDNQKGRTAKTKVKGSDAKQAKAAWNDWNSSNTPGRFTFVAVKPVATEMDEERSKGTAFDMSTRKVDTPKAGSTERGAKHDITHSTSDPRYKGRTVIRRTDAQGISVGSETDDEGNKKEKRTKAGRPDGTGKKIGAKGPSGKSKLMTKEGEDDPAEKGEYDREGDMALDDIDTIESAANELQSIIDAEDNLPEWVQSKINKAMDYLDTARDYMAAQGNDQEPIAEKAVSKKQQRFMGMARAMQKGEKIKGASKELKKVASTMKPKDTEDFAKTKHKGLPDKVSKKKEEVDENSEEGRLTVKQTGPGKTSTSSSTGRISATVDKGKVSVKPAKSGGISYGQGIYDSMNRELELMIAESMSINMSDSTEGNKSLTVTATDEDAMKLAMILKSAGLGGHSNDMHSHGEQPCATCGMPDCGCGDVQEAVDDNAPDYPTNTEQADNNFGYAGGLNKPKADIAGNGQSTVPVVATRPHNNDDLRRMMEMAGIRTEDNIDLGPTSPEVARMSKDEVNAALRSGMSSKVDLGPTSPDIAGMSKDEVDAALRSGMSPDISNMDPDSVNAEFNKEDRQYEDSMQRMREMAGIKEASLVLDPQPRTGSYPDQLWGKDRERYDAVQTGSGPESQRVNQHYQNKPAGSYDPMTKHADQGAADYADRLNAVRAARIANNELTPGEWMQKGTNAVRKAFGGEDRPLKPARTVVDLDGPDQSPAHRYVGSDKPQWPSTQRYLDPKADAQYKARQKALFPDEFKEEKTEEGNLFTKGLEDNDVKIGDRIPGTDAIKTKDIGESIFALTNQWKAYKG